MRSRPRIPAVLSRVGREDGGYTLIELLIATAIGLIVTTSAFMLLEFTTNDVSRITTRVHVTQAGRVALERLMMKLHSTCVAPLINPIVTGSSSTTLRFISESGSEPSLATVRLREVVYTPAAGKSEGTLVEKSWLSTGGNPPEYTFNEKATPTTRALLTGVRQTEAIPVFQYYRYYQESDPGAILGELNPNPMTSPLKIKEAEAVTKVTVSFTLAPEGKESATFNGDGPVALEDSAVLRLSPSSSSAGIPNFPCSQS